MPAPTTPSPATIALVSSTMHLVPAWTPANISVLIAVMRAPFPANEPPRYRWCGIVVSSRMCPVCASPAVPATVNVSPAADGAGSALLRMSMSKNNPESAVMWSGGNPGSAGNPGSRYSMRATVSSSDASE